jgi:hypothetical protein
MMAAMTVESMASTSSSPTPVRNGIAKSTPQKEVPVVIGGGTPFLPPVTQDAPLDLIETRTIGSRVIYERYVRIRDGSDLG